ENPGKVKVRGTYVVPQDGPSHLGESYITRTQEASSKPRQDGGKEELIFVAALEHSIISDLCTAHSLRSYHALGNYRVVTQRGSWICNPVARVWTPQKIHRRMTGRRMSRRIRDVLCSSQLQPAAQAADGSYDWR
ncbi:hypothetical protein T310_6670, partial [Rasamsonia emersonii CBS 393.64]